MTNSTRGLKYSLNRDSADYLESRGIPLETAKKVGFRTIGNQEGKDKINLSIGGLLLPYYGVDGKLLANRLRPFPSNWEYSPKLKELFLQDSEKLPKFLSKKGGANYPYFAPVVDWKKIADKPKHDLVITEGEVKALSACINDIPTIGLSGVWNFNRTVDDNKVFLPELEDFNLENRYIAICFDSDILTNEMVQKALCELASQLYSRKAKPFLVVLPTEPDGTKNGIDDFIVKHGSEALKRIIEHYKLLHTKGLNPLKVDKKEDKSKDKDDPQSIEVKAEILDLEPKKKTTKGLLTWALLKDDFIYRDGYGWYQWTGKYWQNLTDENIVMKFIREIHHKNNWLEVHDEPCYKLFKPQAFNCTIEFDNHHYLGFNNGYLNISDNKLINHDKKLYLTQVLPFDYNPNSNCPQWLKFLDYALEGDLNKINSLRAWIKWILLPKENKKYPIESTLWLVGSQGTGKGTVLDVLVQLAGEKNTASIDPRYLGNENMLFDMAGKKLALNSDCTGYVPDIGNYNKICSNELIGVKKLYQNQTQARLNTVIVLAMNEVLSFSGKSAEGLKRRLHVLEFDNPPRPEDKDPYLSDKLSTELSGIFDWAWSLPDSQMTEILKWRDISLIEEIYEDNQPELYFLIENYPDGANRILNKELFESYTKWCENGNYKPMNLTNFGKAITKIQGISRKKSSGKVYWNIQPMSNHQDSEFTAVTLTPSKILGIEEDNQDNNQQSNEDKPITIRNLEGKEGIYKKTENELIYITISEGCTTALYPNEINPDDLKKLQSIGVHIN